MNISTAFGLLALTLLTAPALARDPDGIYAQRNDPKSQWYRNQQSPKTGGNCCSEADAVTVDEDIRYDAKGVGHYWARWDRSGGWMQVPDDVVIKGPNMNGAPVVWWIYTDNGSEGAISIRCYAPGPLL